MLCATRLFKTLSISQGASNVFLENRKNILGRRSQSGFTVIELLIVMAIMSAFATMVIQMLSASWDYRRSQEMGVKQAALSNALHSYITANAAAIVSGPVSATVPLNTLVTANLLGAGFPATDPWGDSWVISYKVANVSLINYGVGVTKAPPIKPGLASFVASIANSQSLNGDHASVIGLAAKIGAPGAWDAVAASLPGGFANNSPAVIGFVGAGSIVSDKLSRVKVPGHPEANQMQTDIDMNAHDINNGHDITATDQVLSGKFTDNNDNTYYVVPSQSSNVNAVAATGNVTVGGTLGVTGDTTLSGNASVGQTLTATGQATMNGGLIVNGQTQVNGNINVTGSYGQ